MSTFTSQTVRARAPRAKRTQRRDLFWVTVFLAPALTLLLIVRIWPAATAIGSSLMSDFSFGGVTEFVGLDNLTSLFTDSYFQQTIVRTLIFNLVLNPLQVGAALILAWFLTRKIHAVSLWRGLLVLPIAVPIVGSTIVWRAALEPNGPVNSIIQALGGNPQPFFTSSSQALASIMVIASWVGIGYWMLFLITAIKTVPEEILEAAKLDRAGPMRIFFQIVIPMIRRQLLFVLVACTVANFALFVPMQIITHGGPDSSTTTLMYAAYQTTFDFGTRSTGAAQIIVLLILMLLFVTAQFRLLREER